MSYAIVRIQKFKAHAVRAIENHESRKHTDFHTSVGKLWDLNRGESREEKRKHLDTEEYKLKARKAELAKEAEDLQFYEGQVTEKILVWVDSLSARTRVKILKHLSQADIGHCLLFGPTKFIKPADRK